MQRKKVLITGAAGFLGSHLCDKFIREGFHVIGMDNLITGDLRNIEHLFKLENFEFYHHDVTISTSAPNRSHNRAISFMNEIFVARNELAAYFVSSADFSSIKITGLPCLTKGA